MKNNIKVLIGSLITILLLFILYISYYTKNNIKIIEDSSNIKPYFVNEEKTIYTYNIKSIKYKGKELNTDINIINTINLIKNSITKKEIFKDGGSILYKGNNINILTCNTLDGNNDIYIGNTKMTYENDFCKSEVLTFEKTYELISIMPGNNEEYIYLTLKDINKNNDEETVKIPYQSLTFTNLTNNTIYNFTFKTETKNITESNIKTIFMKSKIINITLEK